MSTLLGNVKRVERRLLRETQNENHSGNSQRKPKNDSDPFDKVFTHSGSMVALEDPAKSILQGPVDAEHLFVDRSIFESFGTYIAPAKSLTTAGVHIAESQGHAMLDVDVYSCSFDDHPLFVEEDKISKKLIGLMEQYKRVLRTKSIEYWFSQTLAVVERGKTLLTDEVMRSEEKTR